MKTTVCVLALLAAALAGCGGGAERHYSLSASQKCLLRTGNGPNTRVAQGSQVMVDLNGTTFVVEFHADQEAAKALGPFNSDRAWSKSNVTILALMLPGGPEPTDQELDAIEGCLA